MKLKTTFGLLGFFAAACSSDSTGPEREPVREFTVHEVQAADATVSFGLELFQQVSKLDPAKPNLMLSPLSVSMALGMTMNGAEGETYQAMRSSLGFGT